MAGKKIIPSKPGRRRIQFRLDAPKAREVCLAGNFNQWDGNRHPLKRNMSGTWEKILMLPPGTYEYKYIVDGCWQEDPANGQHILNSYGTVNSLIKVDAKR